MIQTKQLRLSPPPSPPPHSSLLPFFLYAMRRTLPAFLLFAVASVFLFAFFSLHLSRPADLIHHYPVPAADADRHLINYAVRDHDPEIHRTRHVSSVEYSSAISTAAVLLPAWEILIIVSPETPISSSSSSSSSGDYLCLFQNNDTSPARFSKALPFTNRTTLTCPMPNRVKRLRPFLQPVLKKSAGEATAAPPGANLPELIRWNYMVYESFTTEDDVVVFAKGLNNRQGVNRPPSDFRCVFGDVNSRDAVRTAVTSSVQEVFRCGHPNLRALDDGVNSSSNSKQNQQQEEEGRQNLVRISLEIVDANVVVPTVAYYSPTARPSVGTTQSSQHIFSKNGQSNNKLAAGGDEEEEKHVLCACTMVYNVAKFLREWVIYHSEIGVDRFILYDNDSDDNLESVVGGLNREGYNVTTLFWIWPKTQEAGFSHSAIYARHRCKWVAYIDVDEFAFAPYSWAHSDRPSKSMLKSLLPKSHNIKNDNTKNGNSSSTSSTSSRTSSGVVGQVSIKCNDFGPSNQKSHPVEGVTQGYTCRRRFEQRHKSIVMVEGVADSLLNAIHHFEMKKGYGTRQVSMEEGVVNHYKYQAWAEFQTKFRRRVSAYVVDWTQALNPKSKDRTPGLGFRPVEPKGWADMFCEVRDDRLKMLTKRWFGSSTPNGNRMVWQT